MGYEKVKSMSIDINKLTMTLTCASSNVTPITYNKFKIDELLEKMKDINILTNEEKFLMPIIEDVANGHLKLQKSVSTKLRYTFVKTIEFIKNLKANINDKNIGIKYSNDPYIYTNEIKEIVKVFKQYYFEKDKKINQSIYILNKGYFVKSTQNTIKYRYSKSVCKKFNSYKEIYLQCKSLSYLYEVKRINI
ncbi:hypothetical protein [Staphylococcus aureus]|uniref:hypothetical protein n=1 Tax=Staphylococcus aureus TaxID=1280 RepID=UPI000F3E0DA0|nr:hypothetical protein [Staphylococcus aureus]RNG64456.1 hypothetical protein D1G04_14385 [Staphylococcus aureus]